MLVLLLSVIELVQAASAGMLGALGSLHAAVFPTLMVAACMGVVALTMTDGLVRRALSARPVRFLGAVSFSLYLTHAVTIGALEALLPRMGVVEPLVQAAMAVAWSMKPLMPSVRLRNWRSTLEMVAWRPPPGLVWRISELVELKS